MKYAALLIAFFMTGTLIKVHAQSDLQKIRELIINSTKINVDNASPDPNGDIITPRHSVGFSGSGSNRIEQFEERRKLTKQLEKYIAFNPNSDAIFPGALVQGKSLPDGVLSPIRTYRNPLTITVTDLVSTDAAASYSKKVNDPTLANVTDAISSILNQNLSVEQPAKITYSQTTMSSLEEAFLKLGASYKWATGNVSGSFQTSSLNYRTSYMVRYVQSYYTVSSETPSDPASFISRRASFNAFRNYVDNTNPPTFISSVTYGRELWMLIESNYEASEIKATLNAAFSAGFASGALDLNAEQKKVLNESNIQILILGGGGRPAVEVVAGDHVSKLKDYLLAGANYSKTSPGVIISYTVRYLKDNDVARVSSSTDYTIKTNQAAPETILLTGIRVTWKTAGDDKDWNTQPTVVVYDKNGRVIGNYACCSSDRNGDKWENNRSETRDIPILVGGLTIENLSQGHYSASRNPVGNDDWDYTVVLEFTFSNGQRITHQSTGRNSHGNAW